MAGIYIHIPFCKQACYYCNFHFTTSLRGKNELVAALLSEITQRKDYLQGENIETIYLGGGTPSLLASAELGALIEKIRTTFIVDPGAEITLEANPDDITGDLLIDWKKAGFNRLSIGVQSFFEEDLHWMNRAHTAVHAMQSVQLALRYFENTTIDLIYGTPSLSNEKWKENVDRAVSLGVPHVSCYALTVEQKTPLEKMILKKKTQGVDPDKQSEQFLLLMKWMEDAGYEHYEISNFAKKGFRSRHNSAYWQGKKYLGIGPSAHSFDGPGRQWNITNNQVYIRSINSGMIPAEKELLTLTQQLNEYIMTALRTMEGLDMNRLDENARLSLLSASKKPIARGLMENIDDHLILTREGKLLADGIAAELFFED